VEEAIRLVDRGAILRYRMYPCERFEGEARATQCYNCGKWGHRAKYCTGSATCMLCGGPAHSDSTNVQEREATCPVRTKPEEHKPRCLNCGGQHAAFTAAARCRNPRALGFRMGPYQALERRTHPGRKGGGLRKQARENFPKWHRSGKSTSSIVTEPGRRDPDKWIVGEM
ncbi:hypothetical protein QBC35DRAFT_476813, partial [Podospora australis]